MVDLADVRSRNDLLDRWWDRRVADGAVAKEALLREMIAERPVRLGIERLPTGEAATSDLLSQTVLVRYGDTAIAFRHAVILDYAVERLLFAGDPDAFVFILPSLRAHFEALFAEPARFFRELRTLFADGHQRATLLLMLAKIPVGVLQRAADVAPLLDGEPVSIRAFRMLVRAVIHAGDARWSNVGPGGRSVG